MAHERTTTRQHADWLSLVEIYGPFLSMPVLLEVFPHGLDNPDNEVEVRRRARLAYEEWMDNQDGLHPEAAIHWQWLRFVLEEVLEFAPDMVLDGPQIPVTLNYRVKDSGEIVCPQLVVCQPDDQQIRMLVQLYPATQDLMKVVADRQWKASPATYMTELLRNTGTRLGLITNGRAWMLLDAPAGETTGYYSWDASLWAEEPLALRSFRSVLGRYRLFDVPDDETLEALLTKSAQKQQEVTDQLGEQVRRAVDMLVRTLDRLDKDSQRTLLDAISDKDLYEAALTVMMRLVFLLSAEERDMLPLGEPLYDQNYAASTLLKQLQEQADQHTEDVLSLRCDAWSRLLALFRLVYGGVEYPDLRLPAYGGRLFDPDRFPFLEGRKRGTFWRDVPAQPLFIDNRTVLHLLRALQYLQVRVPGGPPELRRLSFRGLDIEQIGHVYEGLLDHTARRAQTTILGLQGAKDSEPEAILEDLERHATRGEEALINHLCELTGRSEIALRKALGTPLEEHAERSRLMGACDNQPDLFARVLPFTHLLRKDTFDNFVLVTAGSIYVTRGSDRRSTGTHYTPRSLTEPIVQHALDPLVYSGPAEGWPREQWQLRKASEILDLKICDMAMGSGAFLVQTCRYLSEKLVQAWENAEHDQEREPDQPTTQVRRPRITPEGSLSQGRPGEELLPLDIEERLALARRLVSERCLYGVDKNPMAVEMAKLSLWLITIARNRPFTFLDHALRCGDSLLGADERQLHNGSLDAVSGTITQLSIMSGAIRQIIPTILQKRRQISQLIDRNIHDIETKERLLRESDRALDIIKLGADLLIGIALSDPKRRQNLYDTLGMQYVILSKAYDEALHAPQSEYGWVAKLDGFTQLRAEVETLLNYRTPFHWPIEFPEVFMGKGDNAGFSAIVGNPPFQGGQKITGVLGTDYRDYLVKHIAHEKKGSADLCAYFFLRATSLTHEEGMCALLATNTIAQGNTREVGLDQIMASGWSIPRAIPSRKWPGEASLEVAHVWLRHGGWLGGFVLNDNATKNITPYLTAPGQAQGKPYLLITNADKSFQGSIILGKGFVLEPEEAQNLIDKDIYNKDILFPYLNGEDLNSRYDQSASRWVINFYNWPLEEAEVYPDGIRIVREKVKPEREKQTYSKSARDKWWQYERTRPELYTAIANMERVLVIPRVSKYMISSWKPTGIVYSEQTCIIATKLDANFALIQCTFHDAWARFCGSTLETRMRYTPSDCFETFPSPTDMGSLHNIGERYNSHRQGIMLAHQEGLTKTYNRFHNPNEFADDIVKLRELHREMDEAVARAYGWDDLKLEHGFHETKQGLRYTISEAARREVLDRLLLLNHERHEEEVRAGLWDEKTGKPKKGKGDQQKARGKNGQGQARSLRGKRGGDESRKEDGAGVVDAGPVTSFGEGLEQRALFDL